MTNMDAAIPIKSSETALAEDNCATVVNDAVTHQPGLVNVHLDAQHELVQFDYDPQLMSDPDVVRVAQKMGPAFQHRFATCTMRLNQRACEACALALERQATRIPGVRRATASYMGGVLSVTYDNALITPAQIVTRVKSLGVSAESDEVAPLRADAAVDAQPNWLTRARAALSSDRLELICTVVTFVAMLAAWAAERWLGAPGVAAALYGVAYVAGGLFGVKGGLESLRQLTIDVDLLMVVAALGAALVGAPFEGAMLLFLFSLSNTLQNYAMDRTRNAIKALMKLRPNQATVRRGNRTALLPLEKIVVGDVMLVRPGERVPLDGVVVEGESALDQSSITGEAMPVGKTVGDAVLAGAINKQGSLDVRVSKLAKDSTLAKLIKLVEEAQSEKAKTQRFIDKAEQYYALGVIVLTVGAIVVPVFFLGEAFGPVFYRAMTLMVGASPCALVISTPASILSAIGNGARRGVLFKGGAYMEQAAGIKVVAFDKTGTLTMGKPRLTDVVILPGVDAKWAVTEPELLAMAAAVEAKSEHALARATVEAAQQRNLELSDAFAFQAATGKGAHAVVNGRTVRVGNLRYFEGTPCLGLDAATSVVARLQAEGKTSVVVARIGEDGATAQLLGVLAFADKVRADAAAVVRELKQIGVERVVMLTGDNQRAAQAIAAQVGLDEVYADLLPEDKVRLLKEIGHQYGPVAMVGDGVNDAPALAAATLGIAMGAAGTDVALETADVVLMSDDLQNIPYVIALSRQTRKTLIVNLAFATLMMGVLIVAALTSYLPLPLAVIGHEGGTVLVSLNGLRLLLFKRRKLASSGQ